MCYASAFIRSNTYPMAKVYRISGKRKEQMQAKRRNEGVSDEAMQRLSEIMNDSPRVASLQGTEWEIHGLKPAVQWLICEEACKIVSGEKQSMGDVLKAFAKNFPSVVNVLTLALLNDKERIFKDYAKREHTEEYEEVRDALMWGDSGLKDWAVFLGEVLSMIDISFFFESSNVIKTVRTMTLERKTTTAEAVS